MAIGIYLESSHLQNGSMEELSDAIKDGAFGEVKEVEEVAEGQEGYAEYIAHKKAFEVAYHNAFDAAILGEKKTWHSKRPTENMNASVLYFEWELDFDDLEPYSFAKAVNKTKPVYGEVTADGEKFVVMNGNYPELSWKANTDYYIISTNQTFESMRPFVAFNICSECTKTSEFRIEPPYTILGLEKSGDTNDYLVCEGQIPTLLTDLKGFDFNGNEVPMQDINYDWWLGDPTRVNQNNPTQIVTDANTPSVPRVKATLENYHSQKKGDIRLDQALSTLRIYYPDATDLDGIIGHLAVSPNPALTSDMVNYLKELVDAGQLVLHQKSISIPAEPAGAEDPYFYLVACPIHDEQFKRALNPEGPASIIKNGSMEGSDASSFHMGDPTTAGKVSATITAGDGKNGTRGIKITGKGTEDNNNYDTQFFIRANEVIPIGTTFYLEFDYKASAAATVSTQAHAAPGSYIDWQMLGNLSFTTEWKHFEDDIEVTSEMGNGRDADNSKNNSFQSIAFNLWETQPSEGSLIDYYFDNVVLTVNKKQYVAFFCDEPQGLRVKVGEKAPTLKTGFVPGENTFDSYDYSKANDAVLSIRLAKKEQFETVKHGTVEDAPANDYNSTASSDVHFLWLPIRNAQTQTADRVIRKSADYNIYLASTNDPVNDKAIYTAMKKGSLPIVGKIVQLNAINTAGNTHLNDQNASNRLCIYFTENFEVREGYSYTLSLPFQEVGDVNTCDGTILINLKIVPDYEVWTGAAGNTDWNNDENWRRADGNLGKSTEEPKNGAGRNNNELYRTEDLPDESPLKDYVTNYDNYRTAKDRIFRKGFAPLYCTHVLIKSNEWGDAPVLYDALDTESGKTALAASPFPNLRDYDGWDGTTDDEDAGTTATLATSTPILRYDMQARHYELWEETYGVQSNKGREGDLIAEMYQVNSCAEIAFQPGAEMLNAHLLNYDNAWVEYQLDNKRWYLLGSPMQGTISGEWYAPTGTAQQKTTYYEPVQFGEGYDRYSPAIYQRSWDKAKAVLYEVGSEYSTDDDSQTENLGSPKQGSWNNNGTEDEPVWQWQTPTGGADDYLDRLGYKPMVGENGENVHKANVAIKGIWSNTYNDATVDYTNGGFSVMVMNHLKNNDSSNGKSIIRLPKEDTMYDYYKFSEDGSDDGGTDTYLVDHNDEDGVQTVKGRAKNRGRLKSDNLLPIVDEEVVSKTYQQIQRKETADSRYGDKRTYTRVPTRVGANALPMTLKTFTETVPLGESSLGYYLVENPFPCGLDMEKFFAANPKLLPKYWLLTANGQHLAQKAADGDWISPSDDAVQYQDPEDEQETITLYPNGKVAPGQGFFVAADPDYTDTDLTETDGVATTTIAFNASMLAQTRYGEPDAGEPFDIVVGTKQLMETVPVTYDHDNDPDTPEVALMIDDDDDPDTPEVQATVEVPKVDENGNYVVEDIIETVTVYKYKQKTGAGYQFPLKARQTRGGNAGLGLVITARRDGLQSSALVMQRESASDDFLPTEDTETFISIEDLKQVPTVYTLCGRLATTINSIHDFTCLPVGVESNSDAPCTLTFNGVEMLGDSIAFYDAVERKLTPLESGMTFEVSGQTQNRYYLVRSLNQKEAAAETHLQIFTEGHTAKVIASTEEPITNVRCYDTAGRLIHSASPQTSTYSFSLPRDGIYIIDAETENDRKTKKVMTK